MLAYRGKQGCTSMKCTTIGDPNFCYGWHCPRCDAPCSEQGHNCPATYRSSADVDKSITEEQSVDYLSTETDWRRVYDVCDDPHVSVKCDQWAHAVISCTLHGKYATGKADQVDVMLALDRAASGFVTMHVPSR